MQFSWVRQLPHAMAVAVMRRCRVMVFEKPEVIDKTGWGAHRHTTSRKTGMIDTANVACMSDISLLLLKKFSSARLRKSPISPKTPAPQYQPIDRKKRKGKIVEDIVRIEQLRPTKKHRPCSWIPPVPHHQTWGQQDHFRGTLRGEQKSCGTARFAARWHTGIKMWDQSTARYPHWHIWSR